MKTKNFNFEFITCGGLSHGETWKLENWEYENAKFVDPKRDPKHDPKRRS
jgi:hypothetical protein